MFLTINIILLNSNSYAQIVWAIKGFSLVSQNITNIYEKYYIRILWPSFNIIYASGNIFHVRRIFDNFFLSSNHDTGDTNSLDVKKKLWKLSKAVKNWKICEKCRFFFKTVKACEQGHQNNFHRAPYRRQKEAFQHFA